MLVLLLVLLAATSGTLAKKPHSPKEVLPTFKPLGIVGGSKAIIEKVPYQATLMHFDIIRCGATIISKRVIISASHCLENIVLSQFEVRVGTSDRSKGGQTVPVEAYFAHPKYKKALLVDYDIAVILTKEDILFTEKAKPAILPEFDEPIEVGEIATVSGFGRVAETGDLSPVLKSLDVPILDTPDCSASYKLNLKRTMMCAGFMAGGQDACKQDSGGPLVLRNKLVGVVSWAIGCAQPKHPGIYARVARFRKWIDCVVSTKAQCDDNEN